jgi:hypothetical protein
MGFAQEVPPRPSLGCLRRGRLVPPRDRRDAGSGESWPSWIGPRPATTTEYCQLVARELNEVVYVDGLRTAFGRAGPKGFFWRTRADDMAVKVVRELLRRNPGSRPSGSAT